MRHKHRFVAMPITGENAGNGKEDLLGWRVECETCGKLAKSGDTIEEIRASQRREIVPINKLVNVTISVA